ncbi:MAG: hypothetical protein NTZ78_05285 [Candidatus Aureabacteria bacterium]|nr:hypothetical protein [Candidatus Auribacterota bacterium]
MIISNNVDANADVNANSVTAGINGSNVFLSYGTTPTSIVTAAWTKDTAWHAIKVTRNSANLWELFLDGVSKGTGTYTGLTTSSYLQAYERSKANGWDDIRVRKYASPEPGASIGTEESPPTPTPTITPTPTPTITPTKGMDAPGLPTAGSGMYTLQQIYDYMTSGTTLTVESSFQEPTSGPRPTMKSLKQLGDAVKSLYEQCDVTAANVDSGKKFFSTVPGSWGVQTGTR